MDWITVAKFGQQFEAIGAQTALEAEGIPVLLPDAQMTTMYPANAFGGVRLQVPADRAEEAEAILAAFQRGELADPGPGAEPDGEPG